MRLAALRIGVRAARCGGAPTSCRDPVHDALARAGVPDSAAAVVVEPVELGCAVCRAARRRAR